VFKVKNDEWVEEPLTNGLTFVMSNQYTEGTLDLATGAIEATGEKGGIQVSPVDKTNFRTIAVPLSAAELAKVRLTFTNAAGVKFTMSVPNAGAGWLSGKQYTYTVTLNSSEKGSTITSDISDWEDEEEATAEAVRERKPFDETKLNGRVTWDGREYARSGKGFILTADPTDAGLFFKFGSVAGIFSGNNHVATLPTGRNGDSSFKPGDTWSTTEDPSFDPGDVAWSPVAIDKYESIPVYDALTDYPGNVDDKYHNAAQVKRGKGDPCRLVGLDLKRIERTPVEQLTEVDIDNHKWRLPTYEENKAFIGHDNGKFYDHWVQLDGVWGGMFPDKYRGSADTFLPAAGWRPWESTSNGPYNTNYWSSTQRIDPVWHNGGMNIHFRENQIITYNGNPHTMACPVRCVRQ